MVPGSAPARSRPTGPGGGPDRASALAPSALSFPEPTSLGTVHPNRPPLSRARPPFVGTGRDPWESSGVLPRPVISVPVPARPDGPWERWTARPDRALGLREGWASTHASRSSEERCTLRS